MSRFMHKPSATYQAAVAALQELREAEGVDSVGRAYADVVSDEKKQQWAQYHDLRLKTERVCASHLLGKQCRIGYADSAGHVCQLPWDDHAVEGKRGRETVSYISQPYGISWENLQKMMRYAQEHDLEISIDAGSWHFPGWTLLVEYTRQDKSE